MPPSSAAKARGRTALDPFAKQLNPIAPNLEQATRDLTDDDVREVYVEVAPENALLVQPDSAVIYKRFTLTPVGLIAPDDTTETEWEDVGNVILSMEGSLAWVLGDWMAFGDDRKWGETYQKLAAEHEYVVDTLYDYTWVCRNIDFSIRNRDLSFSHYRLLAGMTQEEQRIWLDHIATLEKKPKVDELRGMIAKWRRGDASPTPPSRMDVFSKQYTSFAKRQLALAQNADSHEREQMVKMLQSLAKQIRDLG